MGVRDDTMAGLFVIGRFYGCLESVSETGLKTLWVLGGPVNTGNLGYQQLKQGFIAAETLRVWL